MLTTIPSASAIGIVSASALAIASGVHGLSLADLPRTVPQKQIENVGKKKIFPRGFHTSCEFLRADTEERLEPFCFLELTGVDSKHPFCTTLSDGTKVEVKPRRASFLLYACRLLIYISWQCGTNFPACVELLSYLLPHIEANEKRQLAYATKEGLSRRKPSVTDEDD